MKKKSTYIHGLSLLNIYSQFLPLVYTSAFCLHLNVWPDEDKRSSGTGIADGCEPSYECWKSNSGLLQEQ